MDAKFKSLDEEHLSQTGPCPLSRLHDVSRNTISHFEQRVRDFLRGEMDAGMKGRGGRERKNKEGKKPKKKPKRPPTLSSGHIDPIKRFGWRLIRRPPPP